MNGDQNGGYSYGVRGKEGERIFEFCAAMNITVGNILFKKRASLLIIYESGPLRKLRSIIVWSGETNESS